MRTLVLAGVFGLLGSAGPASAQTLSIEFHDGQVRLIAENVTVGRILAEWTRVGGTRIVNGERIPGGPVSLQLVDVPERQALDVVLRGAAGYMVAGRDTTAPGNSTFDRVMVLPTTARAPSAQALPPPPPPGPQFIERPTDDDIEDPEPTPQAPPVLPPGFPRGRVQTGVNPGNAAPPVPNDDDLPEQNPDQPIAPTPGNPFGIPSGSARPGTIAPPRNPNEPRPQ
jgi:hypothetical protein